VLLDAARRRGNARTGSAITSPAPRQVGQVRSTTKKPWLRGPGPAAAVVQLRAAVPGLAPLPLHRLAADVVSSRSSTSLP
jgi:hypothetical protein